MPMPPCRPIRIGLALFWLAFAAAPALAMPTRFAPLAGLAPRAASESDFVAGLEVVRGLREERDYSAARIRLKVLLSEHEGQDYVLHRLSAIREEFRRCAVRLAVPQPKPASLVSGKLAGYSPSTGSIHLVYTPDTLGDFEKNGDLLLHPLTFVGNYSLEIEGDKYLSSPIVLVGLESERSIQVQSGEYERTDVSERWASAKIIALEGKASKVEDEVEKPKNAVIGKSYRIKVSVSSTRVTATFNGRSHLSGPKTKGVWGQIAVGRLEDFKKIVIRGQASPAWLQGRVDRATRDAEREFLAGYDVEQDLPSWLRGETEPAPSATKSADRQESLPWTVRGAESVARANELSAMLNASDFVGVLRDLDTPFRPRLPAEIRNYFKMVSLVGLERFKDALEVCELLVRRAPRYVPILAIHARLLQRIGSRRAAIEQFENVVERDPARTDAYISLARLQMEAGNLDAARDVLLQSRRASIRAAELEQMDIMLEKARRGPNFARAHETETDHYRIVSDIDVRTCIAAGKELEAAYARYRADLGPLAKEGNESGGAGRARVFLFSGRAGYMSYTDGIFCDNVLIQSSAGAYSFALKQLLIWNLPRREEMMETIRHEALHQYLDRLGTDPPTWFNEGLAEYYSVLRPVGRTGRKFEAGGVDRDAVRLLKRHGLMPLSEFLYLEGVPFYRDDAPLRYAQAWALVHYLRHGGPSSRPFYDAMMIAIRSGIGKKASVDRVFGATDLAALDAELAHYVEGLDPE